MCRLIWLGAAALLLLPQVAWSQEPPAIGPGSRIRIIAELEAGRSGIRSGTVVTLGADTVVLRLDRGGDSVPFALARISRIELSRGRKGHIAAGVGLGFLAGAGTGALIGALAAPKGTEEGSAIHAALGAGVGAGIGMLVGAGFGAIKTEQWEVVPSSRWHVSAWPAGSDGFTLALSLRF